MRFGDRSRRAHYGRRLLALSASVDGDEVLYGRAGYLSALLHARYRWQCVSRDQQADFERQIAQQCETLMAHGVQGASSPFAMMYCWHGKRYLGAAHGLCGVLAVLLDAHRWQSPAVAAHISTIEACCNTLAAMALQMQGNLPSSLEALGKGRAPDLVQWCHGAPAVALLLAKAVTVLGADDVRERAMKACGEVVWREGILCKGVGLCHGVAGNGYALLSVYKATGDSMWLQRARAFARLCVDPDFWRLVGGQTDDPYSLFNGRAGALHFVCDVLEHDAYEGGDFPCV